MDGNTYNFNHIQTHYLACMHHLAIQCSDCISIGLFDDNIQCTYKTLDSMKLSTIFSFISLYGMNAFRQCSVCEKTHLLIL